MSTTYIATNLKALRKQHPDAPSQDKMAQLLGLSPSTYGAYEEGRAEPKLEALRQLARFFNVTIDDLVYTDLRQVSGSIRTDQGNRILITTLAADGERENIEYVPLKALAGYTTGHADPEYIRKLDSFNVPFFDKQKKYRAFPIEGDSMPPVKPGSVVFGQYIENWRELRHGELCIVVTLEEGIVFKKVFNYIKERGALLLTSTNELYKPYIVPIQEVKEIWRFAGYFSFEFG